MSFIVLFCSRHICICSDSDHSSVCCASIVFGFDQIVLCVLFKLTMICHYFIFFNLSANEKKKISISFTLSKDILNSNKWLKSFNWLFIIKWMELSKQSISHRWTEQWHLIKNDDILSLSSSFCAVIHRAHDF